MLNEKNRLLFLILISRLYCCKTAKLAQHDMVICLLIKQSAVEHLHVNPTFCFVRRSAHYMQTRTKII